MIKIGAINKLKILSIDTDKTILDGEEYGDVLLNEKNHDYDVADSVEVFIYTVSDGELKATFKKPYTLVNEFAYLKVKEVNNTGAFLDWGLDKDLFLPFRNQKDKLKENDYCIVYTYLDEISQRIVSSSKIEKHFRDPTDINEKDEVLALAFQKTDMGIKCIINHQTEALLFYNDVFRSINIGDCFNAYIKQIRTDGKIDLELNKSGQFVNKELKEIILDKLKENNGVLNISDKSDPKEIYAVFAVSKAQYKKAIGSLFKDRKIQISQNEISLTKNF